MYIKSAVGRAHKALYADMNANVSVVFKFIVHNVLPKSHTSDTTMKVTPLIWCIMPGTQVDVARLIANELKSVALKCATGSKASLNFPGLIMSLLISKGVEIPEPADEEIQHPIDDTFISSLVKREKRTTDYHGSSDDKSDTSAGIFDFSSLQSFMAEQNQHKQLVRD